MVRHQSTPPDQTGKGGKSGPGRSGRPEGCGAAPEAYAVGADPEPATLTDVLSEVQNTGDAVEECVQLLKELKEEQFWIKRQLERLQAQRAN